MSVPGTEMTAYTTAYWEEAYKNRVRSERDGDADSPENGPCFLMGVLQESCFPREMREKEGWRLSWDRQEEPDQAIRWASRNIWQKWSGKLRATSTHGNTQWSQAFDLSYSQVIVILRAQHHWSLHFFSFILSTRQHSDMLPTEKAPALLFPISLLFSQPTLGGVVHFFLTFHSLKNNYYGQEVWLK
jgi:hypothetical protein